MSISHRCLKIRNGFGYYLKETQQYIKMMIWNSISKLKMVVKIDSKV